MNRTEDQEIRKFLLAVGAAPGLHVQRVHVLKTQLPNGTVLTSTLPGTPDVYLCVNGQSIWLEFKRPGGGRAEESQKVWHKALTSAGGEVWIVRDGLAAAIDVAARGKEETKKFIEHHVEAIRAKKS
jgi:hypothetical protein